MSGAAPWRDKALAATAQDTYQRSPPSRRDLWHETRVMHQWPFASAR